MAQVTAQMVKELRDMTGVGMMDAKRALVEVDGDMDKAVDYLRENGMAKAAKKADRIAAEGLANVYVDGNTAVIAEINAETDFVAKNDKFQNLVADITAIIAKNKPETVEAAFGKMHDFARSFLLKKGILFAIALKENPSPIGYILCNSPLQTFTSSDLTMDEWTINFWLAETSRHQGIMRVAINTALNYLKSKNVSRVFAFADRRNETSIHLLQKCNMEYIDDSSIKDMMTFGIKL